MGITSSLVRAFWDAKIGVGCNFSDSWLPVIELQAPRGDRHPNVRSRAELEFFERRENLAIDRMTDNGYDDGSVSISLMFSLHFFSLWNTIALRIGLLFEKN